MTDDAPTRLHFRGHGVECGVVVAACGPDTLRRDARVFGPIHDCPSRGVSQTAVMVVPVQPLSRNLPRLELIEQQLDARRRRLEAHLKNDGDRDSDRELRRVLVALHWCQAGVYGRCCVCRTPLCGNLVREDPADMRCEDCRWDARRNLASKRRAASR